MKNFLKPNQIKKDIQSLEKWGKDWTNGYEVNPSLIVFPEENTQVVEIVKFAINNNLKLVPSGGRTGLSGGAVASNQEIVVSFDRMNKILDFCEKDRIVKCQSGLITKNLQDFALSKDLFYPVDFASSGSSQIGGNIATNAGGIRVIRYGNTRNWVTGLKVITGEGKLLDLNSGLVKNATGYDLRHLFIGSEGTLGMICEAEIALTKTQPSQRVMLLGVEEVKKLTKILEVFSNKITLSAFEFFSDLCLNKVKDRQEINPPFSKGHSFYALIEFNESDIKEASEAFEICLDQNFINDGILTTNEAQSKKIWKLRESISESLSPYMPYKNDLSVKVGLVPEFLKEVDNYVNTSFPEFEVCWYGHIGDGNLHLNILKPENLSIEEFNEYGHSMSPEIFNIIKNKKGSISAEHGVGILKRNFLEYSRSPSEIDYMVSLKKIFDPHQILNPGKLLPLDN